MVYTTHLWWLGGWFTIAIPTLSSNQIWCFIISPFTRHLLCYWGKLGAPFFGQSHVQHVSPHTFPGQLHCSFFSGSTSCETSKRHQLWAPQMLQPWLQSRIICQRWQATYLASAEKMSIPLPCWKALHHRSQTNHQAVLTGNSYSIHNHHLAEPERSNSRTAGCRPCNRFWTEEMCRGRYPAFTESREGLIEGISSLNISMRALELSCLSKAAAETRQQTKADNWSQMQALSETLEAENNRTTIQSRQLASWEE